MKRILLSTLLALPLAISSLPSQASAAEVIVRPNVHRATFVRQPVVVARRVVRQKLIPGHWVTIRQGRRIVKRWVPARYVTVRR